MRFDELNLRALVRVIRTLAFVLVFAEAASAQSTLNFVRGFEGGDVVAIANTSSDFADVQFTFYKPDGSLPAAALPFNPVSYRIPPKGRIAMTAVEIFGAVPPAGWIQASSAVSGLGAAATEAFKDQIIPLLLPYSGTSIQLTNSGNQPASAAVKFHDAQGHDLTMKESVTWPMAAHNQIAIPVPAGSTSARIASNFPVLATAAFVVAGAPVLIQGQATDQVDGTRIVPLFKNGNGSASLLALTNPYLDPLSLTIKYVRDSGEVVPLPRLTIAGSGSAFPDIGKLTTSGGHLEIDSEEGAPTGLLLLGSQSGVSVIPLAANPADRILFSDTADSASLALYSPATEPTKIELTLSKADGTTIALNDFLLSGSRTIWLRDLFEDVDSLNDGFVTLRSSGAQIYALEILNGNRPGVRTPQSIAQDFAANPVVAVPSWSGNLDWSNPDNRHAGDALVGRARDIGDDLKVICGGKPVDSLDVGPDPVFDRALAFRFLMPQIEPGFVNCRLSNGGMESDPETILVMDPADSLTDRLTGQAFYQKVEVTDNGLDVDRASLKPVRNARIEVVEGRTSKLISVSETDGDGRFVVAVPPDATDLSIRAVSRLRSVDLKVQDNTNGGQFYIISSPSIDMRERPASVPLVDRSRQSGAFNILEQIERANDFVHAADPRFAPFPFTIFWSEKNQNKQGSVKDGFVGTTYFNFVTSTAYILGDRATDSDEFDDSVLIHEYAHMLAAKFSRDDSGGGAHRLGDKLDPRVAWSEGFANFFSGAVRNDSIYRDSSVYGGRTVLRYDLEENYPAGSWTGYGSETSVQALLWDFLDDKNEVGDVAQIDFSQIWAAFTDLGSKRYVYLPYFLDQLLIRNPSAAESIQRMVQAQAIDFQPEVNPSVTNPFPAIIAMNSSRTGELDSLTPSRTNLAQSSHFFTFTTTGGPTWIQMTSNGLGPANNPRANDLDLFLFDMNVRQLNKSERGLNGEGELIGMQLPPGSYVIEVRSYFTNGKGILIFNSGAYRLTLSR